MTGPFTEELKAELKLVPNGETLEELQDAINILQSEADAIVCGNARVVEEHR